MARIRTIKPEFPHSESMGRVSRDARLTFVMLFTLADDAGRLRGSSRMLASLLFPYDDDAPGKMESWLGELVKETSIKRYEAGGHSYIEIENWLSHQKIDHPSKSKLPGPGDDVSRILEKPREASLLDQGPKDQGSEESVAPNGAAAGKPAVIDLKAVIFGPVLKWFKERTDRSEQSIRSWLGKGIKGYGEGVVLEVCQEAARENPIDPFAWVGKVMQERHANGKHLNGTSKGDRFARAAAGAILETLGPDAVAGGEEGAG